MQSDKKTQDKKIRQKIAKEINSQVIDNVNYYYSILRKKSKSGLFFNERVFFIIQNSAMATSNQIPKQTLLPFEEKTNIPPFKAKIELDRIVLATSNQQNLSIKYKNGVQDLTWDFECPNATNCKNWERRINKAVQELKDLRNNPPTTIEVKEQQEPMKANEPFNEPKSEEKQIEKKVENQIPQNEQPVNQPEEQKQVEKVQQVNQQQNFQEKKEKIEEKKEIQEEAKQEQNLFAKLLGSPQQSNSPLPQKRVSKPVSSYFIGGVAVESEKDQKELKSKIDTFQVMGSKVKEEYTKKKLEETKLKEETKKQELGFLGGLFKVSLDSKFQIQKLKKEWGYEFAKGVNEYEIIEDFKTYVETVTKKVIDELGLEERKRYYQPVSTSSDMIKYEIHGVSFDIFLAELKEVMTFEEKGTVVSNEAAKIALQEFKNYDYILRLTRNKGKLRVPLAMVVDYKGFTILAKVIIPGTQNYDNMNLLQKQLQILQIQSRVNNNAFFEDPENGRIVPLQAKAYEKLSRAENLNKKFDICYADSLKCYLPHDFNNFSKDKPYEKLRWELIQDDECENRVFYGDDMCSVSNRLKLPQHLRDGIAVLTQLSKGVYERVALLAGELEALNETFTNSKELSKLMHKNGINMRYLGSLLEKARQNWLKELIMAEICARSAKNLLKFDLQDCLLNLSETSQENVYKFQVKQIITFLNKILGSSQDSDIFWKQLNRQSQAYFKASVNKQQINQGFLLQALQHHCRFKLQNIDENVVFFDGPAPFTPANFSSFEKYSKVYDMGFTEHYSSVKNLLMEETGESYDQLKLLLNLTRHNNIPSHFRLSDLYDELIMFLVKWLPPAEARDVYYPQEIQFGEILPSKTLYQIKLTEIKWGLKNGRIQESDNVKQFLVDHVNRWIGDAHPVLTQLYEIYARFFMLSKDQEKKTVNYCKSAIKNQQKLLGNTHQRLADNYYHLGTVYLNYGKKVQAINTLKKAKDIISKSDNEDSQAFGQVCLKMGQLYLAINSPKEAVDLGIKALEKLTDCGNDNSTIQAIELVCRCFEITEDWESYRTLIEESLVFRVPEFIEEIEMTQRIIKAIILPSLKIIASTNSVVTQKLLKLLSELPETTRAPNIAYNFLKQRIEERVFPQQFLQTLEDIEEVLEEIERNGMIARWKGFENLTNKSLLQKIGDVNNKGFNLIANLQALNIFIGGSFIEGVLSEQ